MKFAYDIASWPLSNTNCHRLGEELEGCVNLEDMFRVLYDYIKTTILLCQIYTMYLPIPCCYTMYLPIPCYVYHVVIPCICLYHVLIPCICLYHVLYTRYSMYLIKYYCQLSGIESIKFNIPWSNIVRWYKSIHQRPLSKSFVCCLAYILNK